jgi:hypothetical protein
MRSSRTISRRRVLRQAAAGGLSALAFAGGLLPPARAQGPYGQPQPVPPPGAQPATFQIAEIVEQGHLIFGRASTEIASAIEYTYASRGEPTAYIVGEEAGGAFIGGVRYGEGELRLKSGGASRVFWQGPSLGFDVGAEGSRLLVLAYDIVQQQQIYDVFAGPSGLAYVAGGIGVSIQRSDRGPVLAVIRTGVGLRVGINLGYLRFTAEPTWNPF